MSTDILILNQAQLAIITAIAFGCVPLLLMFAFMFGRFSAGKWYEKNGHLFADDLTRQRWENAVAVNAEKDREIERLEKMVAAREERIRAITAAIRGAQVHAGSMTEVLTVCQTEAM
jgi:hypothetical protein